MLNSNLNNIFLKTFQFLEINLEAETVQSDSVELVPGTYASVLRGNEPTIMTGIEI